MKYSFNSIMILIGVTILCILILLVAIDDLRATKLCNTKGYELNHYTDIININEDTVFCDLNKPLSRIKSVKEINGGN